MSQEIIITCQSVNDKQTHVFLAMLNTEENRWPNFIFIITIVHNSLFSILH